MNRIPPAALTNEIAKSAAVQMAEHGIFIGVDLSSCNDVTAYVPVSIVKEIAKKIPVGASREDN